METFEWIIGLLLAAALLASLARRIHVPYPTLLAIGGACIAFFPHAPNWTLEPDLALALFVAPVLLDAAFDTSLRDLRDNWAPITGLVIVAVGLTTAAVAVVARLIIPEMPWAIAIALGAVVAPPDAAAATAIFRQINLPHRILKILEGESLLNDATALLVYRLAVAAALSGSFAFTDVAPAFLLSVIGSVIGGILLGRLMGHVTALFHDAPIAIIVQFVGTFGVWILAEQIGLSAILTIVAYAITIARWAPIRTPARLRVPAYAVWETAVFVLNVLAFVLIGMQLRPIWTRLDASQHLLHAVFAGAVLATVILVRIVWVMGYNTVIRARIARVGFHPPRPMLRPSLGSGLIIAWSGMRGIVTLAAAFALPETLPNGDSFPYRDLVLITAFAVVLGTLTLQGLTLRPLIRRLALEDGDPVRREVETARSEAYQAALAAIDGDETIGARLLRKEYQRRLERAGDAGTGDGDEADIDVLRRRTVDAARNRTYELRLRGEIGDDAYHILEEEFDWAELSAGVQRAPAG